MASFWLLPYLKESPMASGERDRLTLDSNAPTLPKMGVLIYKDGRVLPPEQAMVSVMDRGFLFGDGVYEAGRSYRGCFLYLEEHWERFRRSASRLQIEVPYSDAELTEGLFAAAKAGGVPEVCFRTIITRGRIDTVSLGLTTAGSPTLVHVAYPLDPKLAEQRKKGFHVLTSKIRRNPADSQDPNIKTSNYLNSLLAYQDCAKRGGEDAILCDQDNNVTEGTNFSVFGVTKSGTVITPALSVGILDSITRRHVITLAKEKYKVEEGHFKLETFLDCAQTFAASSIREVFPIRQWDDRKFPVDGEITWDLQNRLVKEIQSYVETHPRFM